MEFLQTWVSVHGACFYIAEKHMLTQSMVHCGLKYLIMFHLYLLIQYKTKRSCGIIIVELFLKLWHFQLGFNVTIFVHGRWPPMCGGVIKLCC